MRRDDNYVSGYNGVNYDKTSYTRQQRVNKLEWIADGRKYGISSESCTEGRDY